MPEKRGGFEECRPKEVMMMMMMMMNSIVSYRPFTEVICSGPVLQNLGKISMVEHQRMGPRAVIIVPPRHHWTRRITTQPTAALGEMFCGTDSMASWPLDIAGLPAGLPGWVSAMA